jgi:ASC-1-like (ASCH) protein
MHEITLNSPWFELVRDGTKIYEGRRKTTKIMSMCVDDVMVIRHHTCPTKLPYRVCIEGILEYPTYEAALNDLSIMEVLPIDGISVEKGIEIYKQYVSLATQERDGVVMIKLRCC